MTGNDLDPVMGRAIAADGVGTVITSSVGGSPTTTYAENIGVMAATRVYSTAAYYVAAAVAILFGFSPKFGALVTCDPGRRARRHHRRALRHDRPARREDLEGEPGRLRQPDQPGPGRRRHHHRHRQHDAGLHRQLPLSGIALGTIVTIVAYHLARAIAPPHLREALRTEVPDRSAAGETVAVPDQRGSADAAQGTSP